MTTTIAVAGKGGVGKTTVAALVVKYLTEVKNGTVLAIDADPSSNLHAALGLDLEWTVGDIREDMLTQVKETVTAGGAAMGALPGGVSKRDHLDYEIRSSLAEGARCDLIAMGRAEGPGCYCAVNHNLREVIDAIGGSYDYVVVDNEAGLEHLSRRTTRDVQHLLIVTDPTLAGVVAAERIVGLRDELDIGIEHAYVVVNRLPDGIPPAIEARLADIGVSVLGTIPAAPEVAEQELGGRPLVDLPDDSAAYAAVVAMLEPVL